MNSGFQKGNQSAVRLNADEREILIRHFSLCDDLSTQFADQTGVGIEVLMATNQADGIREHAGELCRKIGLDSEIRLTRTGAILDQPIDEFFTG